MFNYIAFFPLTIKALQQQDIFNKSKHRDDSNKSKGNAVRYSNKEIESSKPHLFFDYNAFDISCLSTCKLL